jgi:hypothetical protein
MKDKEIRYTIFVAMMNVEQEFIYQENAEIFYIVKDFMIGWGD